MRPEDLDGVGAEGGVGGGQGDVFGEGLGYQETVEGVLVV